MFSVPLQDKILAVFVRRKSPLTCEEVVSKTNYQKEEGNDEKICSVLNELEKAELLSSKQIFCDSIPDSSKNVYFPSINEVVIITSTLHFLGRNVLLVVRNFRVENFSKSL